MGKIDFCPSARNIHLVPLGDIPSARPPASRRVGMTILITIFD
jgi:hypothetical protein